MFSSSRPLTGRIPKRTMGRARRKPVVLEARTLLSGGFSDSFEGTTLNPFWSTYTQSGSIQLTTAMAHSGNQSVEFISTQTALQKEIELFHNFSSPTYGVTSVWMYDTGAGVASSNYIGFQVSNSSLNFSAELTTFDYGFRGGGPGYGDQYDYADEPIVNSALPTGIERTQAWHQYEIIDTPQSLSLVMDGTTVYTRAGGTPFDQVSLSMSGPYWRPAWTSYFDDFQFTPAGLPDIELKEATQSSASSVSVSYSITDADVTSPLQFDVYRSDQPSLDSSSVQIGSQTLDPSSDPQDLQQGDHDVQLIQGTALPPDPSMQYIVVVADANGTVDEDPASVNTTYFQTFLLGAVVHGFQPNVTTHSPFGGTIRWTSSAVPAWETTMASTLVSIDDYNYVIPFNWVVGSGLATPPGQTQMAAKRLFDQIIAEANQLAGGHPGDVVDLHLIAHSRGADVVTQALQVLQSTTDPALEGSWIKVTLLDPHPATNYEGKKFYSVRFAWIGRKIDKFQRVAHDPSIVLPGNIDGVDIYYQQTPSSRFSILSAEHYLNLWGEGQYDGTITNESNATIDWHLLTYAAGIGWIGHSEVHEWYQQYVVDMNKTLS